MIWRSWFTAIATCLVLPLSRNKVDRRHTPALEEGYHHVQAKSRSRDHEESRSWSAAACSGGKREGRAFSPTTERACDRQPWKSPIDGIRRWDCPARNSMIGLNRSAEPSMGEQQRAALRNRARRGRLHSKYLLPLPRSPEVCLRQTNSTGDAYLAPAVRSSSVDT
jgi:hypothetical protein